MTDKIEGLEAVAHRRLVAGLADPDDDDEWTGMNPIERVDAAVGRVNEIVEENEQLKNRVAQLEAQVETDAAGKEYSEMSRSERVRKVRETLLKQATRRQGKAQMTYKDVLLLFDDHPSDGYAYKLMSLAAEEEGYSYATLEERGKVIRVDSDEVENESLVHAANNAPEAEAA